MISASLGQVVRHGRHAGPVAWRGQGKCRPVSATIRPGGDQRPISGVLHGFIQASQRSADRPGNCPAAPVTPQRPRPNSSRATSTTSQAIRTTPRHADASTTARAKLAGASGSVVIALSASGSVAGRRRGQVAPDCDDTVNGRDEADCGCDLVLAGKLSGQVHHSVASANLYGLGVCQQNVGQDH